MVKLILIVALLYSAFGARIGKHFAERHSVETNLTEIRVQDQTGPGTEFWSDSQFLDSWYTKLDLCILSDKTKDSVKIIMERCEKETAATNNDNDNGTTGKPLPPIRCRAGNSWPSKGEYCSPEDIPFSERKNLRRAIKGYDDPKSKPLQTFFQGLAQEQGAFLMVGDSVMQQFYGALACELEREGIWSDPSHFTNTDEMKYVEFPIKNHETNEIKKYGVPIKFAPIYHFVNGRWDRVANASMHHLKKNVGDLLHSHKSLTILINMGLHYVSNPIAHFTRNDYIIQMTVCLDYLNNIVKEYKKKDKIVRIMWRETSAQHFPTSNGYWPGVKYANEMKLACEPIKDTSSNSINGDWRNSDINNIINKYKLEHIQIVPFYNVTLPLWSSHVNGHLRDCTHFCWSPFLYQSLFHELAAPFKDKD
jgi:hypothetical protein